MKRWRRSIRKHRFHCASDFGLADRSLTRLAHREPDIVIRRLALPGIGTNVILNELIDFCCYLTANHFNSELWGANSRLLPSRKVRGDRWVACETDALE